MIDDSSFEHTVVASEGQLPNGSWSYGSDANLRLVSLPTSLGPNLTASGSQYVFEFASETSQDGFWQDLNATYQAGVTYSFSAAFGLGQYVSYSSIVALEFRAANNVPVAVSSLLAVTLPEESFERRDVYLTVPLDATYVGEQMRIGFRFSGTGFSPAVDAVRVCLEEYPT